MPAPKKNPLTKLVKKGVRKAMSNTPKAKKATKAKASAVRTQNDMVSRAKVADAKKTSASKKELASVDEIISRSKKELKTVSDTGSRPNPTRYREIERGLKKLEEQRKKLYGDVYNGKGW